MVIVNYDDGLKVSYDGFLMKNLITLIDGVENYDISAKIDIDGKSGLGKSTIAFQIAKRCNKNFSLDDVYFDVEAFLRGLANAKSGQVFVFDEAMIINSRAWATQRNRMIIVAMSMIRSKNIYIIFCINSIFDLDKNLVLNSADILFHVYSKGLIDRGRFCAFFKSPGDSKDRLKGLYLNGKKYYDYSKPRANYYGRFPKTFVLNEKLYEAKKQKAINHFLLQTNPNPKLKSFDRDDLIVKMCNANIKQIQIMEVLDISKSTIQKVKRKYFQEGEHN